jgi:O-antigen/teichoic acid export membrane protein
MSRAREAAGQTLIVMVGRFVGVFVALGAIYFQTRYLTKHEFALVQIVSLLTELCTVMGDLGLGLAIERRLPALLEGGRAAGQGLIGTFLCSVLATTALFCAAVYVLSEPLASLMMKDAGQAGLMALTVPSIVIGVWRNHMFSLMRGTKSFTRLSVFSLTYQLGWVGVSILLFQWWGIRGFLIGLAAGPLLPCLYETWKMRGYLAGPPAWRVYRDNLRATRAYYAERFVNFGYVYADQWVVGAMLNPVALAIYSLPRRIFDQLQSVLDGLWVVPTNVLSRESVRGPEILSRSLASFRRVFLYLFAPMSVGLLVGSYSFLDVLTAGRYNAGWGVFAILSVFFLINGVYAPQPISVSVMAPPRQRLQSLLAQNVTFLAILPLLTYTVGEEGVAAARAIGAAVMAWMSCHFLRRIVALPRDPRARRAVGFPCLLMMAIAVPAQVFFYQRWLAPVYLAAAGAAYVWAFMRLIDESDLQLLEHILPRRLQWAVDACRKLRPATARLSSAP